MQGTVQGAEDSVSFALSGSSALNSKSQSSEGAAAIKVALRVGSCPVRVPSGHRLIKSKGKQNGNGNTGIFSKIEMVFQYALNLILVRVLYSGAQTPMCKGASEPVQAKLNAKPFRLVSPLVVCFECEDL
ncbi:hypothetical protein DUI87_11860 [Hirundo rustica rustica]|uniref:Uncharacterized protein n=1 Tax=Hirundo rustica rustica TaxID=333673 RepID=A0A3M0KX92_HIRRU|nr:hypothetical protein DUI87_11860 [Hirundo rustica rustica]